MKEIRLTKGKIALVDDDDFNRLSMHSWHFTSNGYAASRIKDTIVYMHRMVMNVKRREALIDHRNRNRLDNRKENLRSGSVTQNRANASLPSNNKSGYRGVIWDKKEKKWRAYISINRKRKHLGYFPDPISAAAAYDTAALDLFGEFAHLNSTPAHT